MTFMMVVISKCIVAVLCLQVIWQIIATLYLMQLLPKESHFLFFFLCFLSGEATILYKFILSKDELIPKFAMVISDTNKFPPPFKNLESLDSQSCQGYVYRKYAGLVKCMPTGELIELLILTRKSYMSLQVMLQ